MSEKAGGGQIIEQAKEFLKGLTARQRLLLGGGAALVMVLLTTFVAMLGKPEMTTLYSNMEPADAQALGQKLATKNIKYQLAPDGRGVMVAADQVQTARLQIANEGAPRSGRMGFEIFDKTNWAASDFDDKVNYQRALEGELERTIQAMAGVEAARVHLAIPPDTIYSAQERQAKAAVILKLKEKRLPIQLRKAVQQLVASSVDKLDPANVSVVDSDAGGPPAQGPLPTGGEEKTAEEIMAERLIHTLEPVVGAEHVRATVRLEADQGTLEEQQESYDPTKTATLTMQRSEETNGAPVAGGAAGTPSNVPGGGTPQKASSEAMSTAKSENGTYAVNRVVRHISEPAGRLKRLAVAVLVDDRYNAADKKNPRMKRSPEELKSIEELAKASVGFDATRGDILTVQNISFQLLPVETPAVPTRWERLRQLLTNWMAFVRLLVMLMIFGLTYLLVIRPVKKQLIRSLMPHEGHKALADGTAAGEGQTGLPGAEGTGAPGLPGGEEEPQDGRTTVAKLKDEVALRIKQEPKSASRLVQSWIREDTQKS